MVLHDEAPGNRCYLWGRGDEDAVARAFEAAARTVEIDVYNNRIAGAAIEPRAALAAYDPIDAAITLYDTTQAVHLVRRSVAAQLGMADRQIRVISPDVGGGFGYKGKHYPEEIVVCWAARRLGRPVRWVGERGEAFVTDTQARDHRTRARLALDADGRFLGLRVETVADLGAYLSTFGAAIPSAIYSALLAGVYGTPAVYVEVTGVFTNTVPTDAYRGAGRPEACYILERLADRAAAATGIDAVEIRRRNLIRREAMPYKTPIGPTYDCGDFPKIMERALDAAGHDGFAARRAASEAAGRLRGIGIASFVESSGVAPSRLAGAMGARVGFFESAEIRVDREGCVQALLGTHNHGQGHATSFAQILSARFGVALDRVEIVEGDTGAVPFGTGTFGSRSIAVGGSALHRAADRVVEKARAIAGHMLEAAPEDIAFAGGAFTVAGTDRRVSFEAVAERAHVPHDFPHETLEPGLMASAFYDPPNFAFSNGAHVVEVEIDPETGATTIAEYRVVDDIGTAINPMIVEGQIHGGLAQGIGQAMMEDVVYDPGPASRSPARSWTTRCRAPTICRASSPSSTRASPAPTTRSAPRAAASRARSARRPPWSPRCWTRSRLWGVSDIDMPLTPERVWRAMAEARPAG